MVMNGDKKKIEYLLNGIRGFDYESNCSLFDNVQIFILNTDRFSVTHV